MEKSMKVLKNKEKQGKPASHTISIAPMMDWTNLYNKPLKNNNIYFVLAICWQLNTLI